MAVTEDTKQISETASQTAGPYVHIGLSPKAAGFDIYQDEAGNQIAGPDVEGQRITVEGIVFDGNGDPVKDVLIEVWQPDAQGAFATDSQRGDGFSGWGRIICDFDTGAWTFDTIKPGPVDGEAPHLKLWIVARGINTGLHTRMYFDDETKANDTDPVLKMLAKDGRDQTLIAKTKPGHTSTYRFEIHLQGEQETVFFDV